MFCFGIRKTINRILILIGKQADLIEVIIKNRDLQDEEIDKLKKKVKELKRIDELLSEVATCSKCRCLVGRQFVSEDDEGNFYCRGCESLMPAKKSKEN